MIPRWQIPAHPLTALRWSLSIVLGAPALHLAVGAATGHEGAGARAWFLFALGVAEALGAVLFLLSRSRRFAAWLLAAVLLIAAGFHAWIGETPPLAFLVYWSAIAVVATASAQEPSK